MNTKIIVKLFVYSCGAEAGPPLGTVLGNLGINALKFSKEFNDFTTGLPQFLLLPVIIYITESKTYTFLVGKPTSSFFINLLKYSKMVRLYKNRALQKVFYVSFFNFIRLVIFKFKFLNLLESMFTMLGCLNSCNIKLSLS